MRGQHPPPTEPRKTTPSGITAEKKIDLTKRPELTAIITTTVSTLDKKSGKMVQRSKISRKVTATWAGNYARTKPAEVASRELGTLFANAVDGASSFAQDYSNDPNYTSDPSSLTPVLAVANGAAGYNYADTTIDSNGNVLEFYGWAASPAPAPITDAWAYKNGQLLAQYHASWSAATGGYTLSDQTVGSYLSDGTLAGTIQSTVSGGGGGGGGCNEPGGCGPMQTKNESLGDLLATPLRLAFDKLGCWFGPEVANASIQCGTEAAWFGVHTFTLYESTVSGAAFVAGGWYLVEWGVWTHSLYEMLHCFDSRGEPIRPRGSSACRTNPRLCTGGGGSTW